MRLYFHKQKNKIITSNMQANENSTNRIEYIDVAKGIGIFLVVFGHVLWKGKYAIPYANSICNMIYSFHMPLFFVISGLCIKESKTLTLQTVKDMANAYLIPYVVWTVIYLMLFQVESILMEMWNEKQLVAYRAYSLRKQTLKQRQRNSERSCCQKSSARRGLWTFKTKAVFNDRFHIS